MVKTRKDKALKLPPMTDDEKARNQAMLEVAQDAIIKVYVAAVSSGNTKLVKTCDKVGDGIVDAMMDLKYPEVD